MSNDYCQDDARSHYGSPDELRQLRRLQRLVFIPLLPLLAYGIGLLCFEFSSRTAPFWYTALAVLFVSIAVFRVNSLAANSRCPRCNNFFFKKEHITYSFRLRCPHCGLTSLRNPPTSLAIGSFYLGLCSMFLLPAPVAVIVSLAAIRELRRDPRKHGMARAVWGLCLGAIGTCFIFLLFVMWLRGDRLF